MATKRLICAIAVCAGLVGCATLAPPPTTRADCRGGNCKIDVRVENCKITAPDIDVYGANNIFWELDRHAGYKFPEEAVHLGVWIKDPPNGQFDSPKRENDWEFKLHDKNNDSPKGTYRYGIQVVKDGVACPDLDPTIVNH